jgi:hypothetical protein
MIPTLRPKTIVKVEREVKEDKERLAEYVYLIVKDVIVQRIENDKMIFNLEVVR